MCVWADDTAQTLYFKPIIILFLRCVRADDSAQTLHFDTMAQAARKPLAFGPPFTDRKNFFASAARLKKDRQARRRQDIGRDGRGKGRKAEKKPRKGSGAGITVPRCGIQ